MKIVEPKVILENYNGIEIEKNIEKACRKCYRSEGNITEDSYKKLLSNCINRGHESILEHEKVTAELVASIGAYKELTRHRFASFSIESTRYNAYNKDKYGNEISVINPCNMEGEVYDLWKKTMELDEKAYNLMASKGAKPDQLRTILPQSTAANLSMTANIREWRHILELRCSKMAHPEVQQLMIPVLLQFQKDMPELFGDIEYNKDFPNEKYANVVIDEEELER